MTPRLAPILRSVVGGVTFTIRSDSPPLVAGLLQRWRALPRAPRGRPELLFDACFRPRRPRLSLNGRSRLVARDANHLLAELELAVYAELCERTSASPLHAAAVAFGGRAVLIAGPSGAGKSTLAWRLLQRGADYLAEEHVFLEAQGLSGLPRALSFADARGEDLGLTWAPRVELGPSPLGLVVLLELPRTSGARSLTPAEAAAGLTQHLHRVPRESDLRRLVEATSRAPALALGVDGIEAAVHQVLHHLSPRLSP